MNPTEIYDALSKIVEASFDAEEFPFSFAEATDGGIEEPLIDVLGR